MWNEAIFRAEKDFAILQFFVKETLDTDFTEKHGLILN